MTEHYNHTQDGKVMKYGLAIAMLGLALMETYFIIDAGLTSWFLHGTFLGIIALLLVLYFLMGSLTARVDSLNMEVWFGPGVAKQTIPLGDIAGAHVITYPAYYGYGIRFTPQGKLYNVAGKQAVKVTFKDGRRDFMVGTDQPEDLRKAIRLAKKELK